MKVETKRKLKGLMYKYKVHRFIPSRKLDFIAHVGYASKWISEQKDLKFTSFYKKDFVYKDREKMHDFLLESEDLKGQIDYLEFGVSKGGSFRRWLSLNSHADSKFYGFDTFDGLPEAWGSFPKGAMSNGNEIPVVNDERATFYQGLFQQTLIPFLKSYKSEIQKVIHMDADLYSATWYVLALITPYLNKGDIILFDEFNVPLDEFKAFKEWSETFYIDYEVLGETNNYYQLSIKIK